MDPAQVPPSHLHVSDFLDQLLFDSTSFVHLIEEILNYFDQRIIFMDSNVGNSKESGYASIYWAPIVGKGEEKEANIVSEMQMMIKEFSKKNNKERRGSFIKDSKGLLKRRLQIHGDSVDTEAIVDLNIIVSPKTEDTRFAILEILKKNFLFSKSDNEIIDEAIDSMILHEVKPHEIIIEQGDEEGDKFYVMLSGTCDVLVNNNLVGFIHKTGSFGELALMYNTPRAATIRARTMCEVWSLGRDVFRNTLISSSKSKLQQVHKFLSNVKLFKDTGCSDEQLSQIARSVFQVKYQDGNRIITQGDVGEEFFILNKGVVKVTRFDDIGQEFELVRLHEGDVFGERALLYDDVRSANIVSVGDSSCLTLKREEFNLLLGHLREEMAAMDLNRIWRTPELLRNLSDNALYVLRSRCTVEMKLFQSQIIDIDGNNDCLYLVTSGSVESAFGEVYSSGLLIGNLTTGLSMVGSTLICKSDDADIVKISSSDLQDVIDSENETNNSNGNIHDLSVDTQATDLDDNLNYDKINNESTSDMVAEMHEEKNDSAVAVLETEAASSKVDGAWDSPDKLESPCHSIKKIPYAEMASINFEIPKYFNLGDCNFVGKIGRGAFGSIFVVDSMKENVSSSSSRKKQYALKVIEKTALTSGMASYTDNEVEALNEVQGNAFVAEFYGKYESKNFVSLRLELVTGGDLFTYVYGSAAKFRDLGPYGGLPLDIAAKYMANVILAVEHIHSKGFAYRDIKAENLLFSANGYLKLADFGMAKKLPYSTGNGSTQYRTYTLCGTPEYLAPEVILTQGHDKSCDIWSLGILLYELLCGITPFTSSNRQKIFQRIVRSDKFLSIPINMDPHSRNIVRKLLNPNPGKRIGTHQDGFLTIQELPFFAENGVDWIEISTQKVKMPFIPEKDKIMQFPPVDDSEVGMICDDPIL